MAVKVYAVDRPDVAPLAMPDRFRKDVTYFMTVRGAPGVPDLGPKEYWVRREDAARWLDELVVEVVSPLDSKSKAEIELTDEQEAWLEWLLANHVERIRVEAGA